MADTWATIAAERGALAHDLDRLTDEQWGTRSLCDAWTVEDVVAHMTSTAQMTPPKFFAAFMVSGFNFPRFAQDGIRQHRGDDPLETLANFRKHQNATKSPPGPTVTWLGETLIHAEDVRRVHEALGGLTVGQRRAVVLAALGGRTAKEIGEIDGIPLGTAKTRIRDGLANVRRALRMDVRGLS